MPPRWGFRKKENEKAGQIPACYTHCAPLERKAGSFSIYRASIQSYTHVAPLGLGLLDMSPVYKHAAPLGLQKKGKRESGADSRLLYTLRSPGAEAGIFSIYRASIRSYAHVAPLGLGLLDMSPIYKHAAPLGLNPPMECFPGSTFDTTLHSAGVRGLGLSRLL